MLKWERIDDSGETNRLQVIGGWLVKSSTAAGNYPSICFVPDPKHDWKI